MDSNKEPSKTEPLKEFFQSKENLTRFNELMMDLTTQIFNGQIEPLDAYSEFIGIYQKVFPKSSDHPMVREILFDRFQTYLLIWILRELGRVKRNQVSKRKQSNKS